MSGEVGVDPVEQCLDLAVAYQRPVGLADLLGEVLGAFAGLLEEHRAVPGRAGLVFHVFAALAEFIRTIIVANTNEGLAAARARG